jgi:hypothetical protein
MLTNGATLMLWRDGRLDAETGIPRLPSPYLEGSDLERAWLSGWDDANVMDQPDVQPITIPRPKYG